MVYKYSFLLLLLLFLKTTHAQFNFEYNDLIGARIGADTMSFPWAGGVNYAQFSDIDIDYDGDMDLFVFDRSSDNIRVYLQEYINGLPSYVPMHQPESLFPSDVRYRATMVDYDGDLQKDLFTYGIGGIKVYRNSGNAGTGLQWELSKNLLYSDYNGSLLNLYVSSADIPAIIDVDADGDIDILTFDIGGQHLQYHQNQSQELSYGNDSLIFILKNECWGLFREDLNTSTLYLNDASSPCTTGNVPNPELPVNNDNEPAQKPAEYQPKHSGSTVLALDIDNSGVLDLILGDVAYPSLNLLINGGTAPNTNSAMISQDQSFPSNSLPVNMHLFPAAFFVDTDFDGKKDLIVAPNAKNISHNETSVLFYKNVGSNTNPTFVYQTNSFLQNDMIEHGTGSIPVFYDFDQDGLEDLFVSNFFRYKATLDKEGTIAYYKNTGTATEPFFTFIDDDFLNLGGSSYGLHKIPTFGDLDGDGDKDLIIGLENGTLLYYQNTSVAPGMSFAAPIANYTDNNGNVISSGQYATPQLFDLDEDGLLDLIVGRKTGELMYYRNIGTSSSPSFQLVNDTLGNIDVATTSPDGYPAPHFFKYNDTIYLFLGSAEGKLGFYKNIESNLTSGSSFTLFSPDFLGIDVGAYSAFWVNDIDQDGNLNLFVGQDLGGLTHLEVDPNSQSGMNENSPSIDLRIFPNPSTGIFNLSTTESSELKVYVFDIFGKEILLPVQFTGKTTIDLSEESSGIYLVILEHENGMRAVRRIVKN